MNTSRGGRDLLPAIGVGVLVVACCAAGPVLLSAGALAGVGALLRSWWLVGVAALIAGALVLMVALRRRSDAPDSCYAPDEEGKRP